MSTRAFRNAISLGGLVLMACFHTTVFGEDKKQEKHEEEEKAEEGGLKIIIASAQKREESIQETPIAVTAFTGDSIDKLGIDDISDVAAFTPNLVFDTTSPIGGASASAAVFIRGIGNTDFSLTTDPGVGTYIDGVYMSRSIGGVLDVLDIERIEVLRGPQGTLFGRNTIGGAINITTRKPYDDFAYRVDLTGGSEGRIGLKAFVDVPITENLISTFALSRKSRDGYVDRVLVGDTLGSEDRTSFRGAFYFEPGDNWDLQFSFDHTEIDEQAAAGVAVGFTAGAGTIGWALATYPTLTTDDAIATGLADLQQYVVSSGEDISFGTFDNASSTIVDGLGLVVNGHGDNFDVKYTLSYRETEAAFYADADHTPFQITEIANPDYHHEQLSHELQIIGDVLDSRLKYIAGIYYLDEQGKDNVFVPLHLPTPDLSAGFAAGLKNFADVDNSSEAVYLQSSWAIDETYNLTVGVRHTLDKKRFDYTQYLAADIQGNPLPFFPGAIDESGVFREGLLPLVGDGSGSISDEFEETTYKLGLDAMFNDTLIYYSFAQGFKNGGFVLRYVEAVTEPRTFEPETLDAHEIGFKWQSSDNLVRLNAAVFFSDYKDVQVTFFDNLGGPITANAGEVDIKGVELEFTALITDNLLFEMGYGYIDASYTTINQVEGLSLTLDKSATLVNTPENSLSIGLQYDIEMDEDEMSLRIDYSYVDDIFNDSQNSPFLFQKANDIFNASATYYIGADINLMAFVKNLTDERIIEGGNSNFGLGFHEGRYNRPREYGLTVRYIF